MRYEILTIVKKARKYFYTINNRYLVINDISRNFSSGDRVIVQANNLTKGSKYGVRYIYEPTMDLTQMTYKQAINIINADKRAYRTFTDDDLREVIEYKRAIDEKEPLGNLIVDSQEFLQVLSF